MAELGISLPLDGLELHEHRDAVDRLYDAGYTGLWTGEVNGLDGLTPLALFAGWRPECSISCAVVSAYTRGPALLAMSAATLGEVALGGARFGIGAGSDVIVNRWNGIPFDRPLQRVTDVLRFVREALTEGGVSTSYETIPSEGFKLARVPSKPPKLIVAALGPAMQRLAAAEADGVVLNFLSADDVKTVRDAAGQVDRTAPGDLEVSARVFVVPGEDAAAPLAARRHIAGYLTVPVYAGFQRWLGRTEALQAMWDAWEAGDRKAATAAIPEDVVDDLVLTGSPERCAEGVRRYLDTGLDAVTIALFPPPGSNSSAEEHVSFLCRLGQLL